MVILHENANMANITMMNAKQKQQIYTNNNNNRTKTSTAACKLGAAAEPPLSWPPAERRKSRQPEKVESLTLEEIYKL